jgi:hypothetical protein
MALGIDKQRSPEPAIVLYAIRACERFDNSFLVQIDAGIDKVCDVLDVDAQNGIRRSHENHHQPRTADLFTWRTRLVSGSFRH